MLDHASLRAIVAAALAEDAPWGDLTSEAFVPASAVATAQVRAREAGVMAGGDVIALTLLALDENGSVNGLLPDGARFSPSDVLATITGSARAVLRAERVLLNLLARTIAVATRTRSYVDAVGDAVSVAGRPVRVVDTRKTTPGLRALEKVAAWADEHWHIETLSEDGETSCENESSVVLYGNLGGRGVLPVIAPGGVVLFIFDL